LLEVDVSYGAFFHWPGEGLNLQLTLESARLEPGPCHLGLSARRQGLLWSICYIHVDY